MKYLQSTPFSTGGNSNNYRDNWDRVFKTSPKKNVKEKTEAPPKAKAEKEVLKIGGTYRHFSTRKLYIVMAEGTHTETGEKLVSYHLSDNPDDVYFRPKEMFMGWKDTLEGPVKRFTLVE